MITVDLPSRLATLDRAGLAALVGRLCHHEPRLRSLAMLPLAGERRRPEPSAVRNRVVEVLQAMPDHPQAAWNALLDLLPLCELGDQYLEAGEVDSARVLWATIAHSLQAHRHEVRDDEGELTGLVADCAQDLGRCLDLADSGLQRQLIIEDLMALWWSEAVDEGSSELHPEIGDVLAAHLDESERRQLAAHLLARLGEVRFLTPADRRRVVIELIDRLEGLPDAEEERSWLLGLGTQETALDDDDVVALVADWREGPGRSTSG